MAIATLQTHIGRVFIIAHQEPTEQLEQAIATAGLPYEVLRQVQQPEWQDYSPSYRCLLNHCQAWQRACQSSQPVLILEADFVPVIDLGQLPLPFAPHQSDMGIAWFYTCAPQVYSVSEQGHAEGFSASTVAYSITSASAPHLLEFAETIRDRYGVSYSAWDSELEKFLHSRGFKTYIPFRNYGEHGGIANPEHRQHGLSAAHRADVLYGPLAFQPAYAKNPWQLWQVRSQARLKGIARLLIGKFLRLKVIQGSSVPLRLIGFALRRQFLTRP
jgi:hypothetical protein